MDYEKAFDYANRAYIILKLISKGCGRAFTEAISKMFQATTYIPSYENKLCEEITTSYGVAQGRNSSPNFYSFFVSDMPCCTASLRNKDFIDPHNLAQLADDTAVLADGLFLLGEKMGCVINYSEQIYQVPNVPKTVFCHLSDNPYTGKLRINDKIELCSVDADKGHKYLGVKFIPTSDIDKIIKFNHDDRKNNWVKFYSWLEVNEETPIEIKSLVLDNCLFNSILYGYEVFGNIQCVEKELRLAEQKALRAILQVKKGTSIDLLYNELKRPDIISTILDSQYNFFNKLRSLEEEDALVISILRLCENTPIVVYYNSLQPHNKENNVSERERRILESDAPMLSYYSIIVNARKKSSIYSNFVDDSKRKIITRWRLSNHKLLIETGRYCVPAIERMNRKCYGCNVLEDESHAIFSCPAFAHIRDTHQPLLEKYNTVRTFLDPEPNDIYEVAEFLQEIEKILDKK